MDEKRRSIDHLGGLEGADAAALGVDAAPESASPAAAVDGDEVLVPGANADDRDLAQEKPWFTSLAYESDQVGVANDPPDVQEPQFPTDAEDPR